MKKSTLISLAFLLAFPSLAYDENCEKEEDPYEEQVRLLTENPNHWMINERENEYHLRYRPNLGADEFRDPIEISEFNFLNEVFPNLYVGDVKSLLMSMFKIDIDLKGFEELKKHFNNSITFSYVLDFSCAVNSNNFGLIPLKEEPEYESFNIEDQPVAFNELSRIMSEKYDRIKMLLSDRKNVLIACFAGQSRSVTAAMLYLMEKEKKHFLEAYCCLKKNRRISQPNGGFLNNLINLQNSRKRLLKEKAREDQIRMDALDLFDESERQGNAQEIFNRFNNPEKSAITLDIEKGDCYFEFAAYLLSLNIPFEIIEAGKGFIKIRRLYGA